MGMGIPMMAMDGMTDATVMVQKALLENGHA
jgi:hypothetical protein